MEQVVTTYHFSFRIGKKSNWPSSRDLARTSGGSTRQGLDCACQPKMEVLENLAMRNGLVGAIPGLDPGDRGNLASIFH